MVVCPSVLWCLPCYGVRNVMVLSHVAQSPHWPGPPIVWHFSKQALYDIAYRNPHYYAIQYLCHTLKLSIFRAKQFWQERTDKVRPAIGSLLPAVVVVVGGKGHWLMNIISSHWRLASLVGGYWWILKQIKLFWSPLSKTRKMRIWIVLRHLSNRNV